MKRRHRRHVLNDDRRSLWRAPLVEEREPLKHTRRLTERRGRPNL